MDENQERPLPIPGQADVIGTAELSIVADTDARRSPRRIVNIAAALRDEDATSCTVRLLDISPEGCRIEAEAPVENGASVLIKLPGLEAKRSCVRWVKGSQAGCEFETPLYAAEIEMMTTRSRRPKPNEVFRRR